jgi:signal transduction histidine kinase
MSLQQENLILIVDDSPTNITAILDMLHEANIRLIIAKSGETALEQINSILPDLILMDVTMPGIDGFETCRRLKSDELTKDIPIIFMTASSDADDKIKGFNLGAVDYVTKPLHKEEVLARVRVHLNLHNLTRELEDRVAARTRELESALENLQKSQLQLIQSEKMSSLGQLLAGVAHEINNPVGSINNNIVYVSKYVQSLIRHLQMYQGNATETDLVAHAQEIDLKYVIEDLPKTLYSMKDGTTRIKDISTSLRIFSRGDTEATVEFNLHDGIDSTLMILQHRLHASATRWEVNVVKNYGDLPTVQCFPGQLNQVFMNILANAIDALDELPDPEALRQIKIQTAVVGTSVAVRIQDNAGGIPEAIKQKIFNHSFTTKPVGKGTGLGLAIARQIVEDKHAGKLEVNSTIDQGTEFVITLPLKIDRQ